MGNIISTGWVLSWLFFVMPSYADEEVGSLIVGYKRGTD